MPEQRVHQEGFTQVIVDSSVIFDDSIRENPTLQFQIFKRLDTPRLDIGSVGQLRWEQPKTLRLNEKKIMSISKICIQTTLRKFLMVGIAVLIGVAANQTVAQDKEGSSKKETESTEMINVLIVDGQNNHGNWPKSTVMMKQFLEESGKFKVDIQRTKYTCRGGKRLKEFPLEDGKVYEELKNGKTDPDFAPVWSDYHVVISNFGHGAAPWPEATQKSFVEFMKNGGGFVSVHAADNSFPKWKEYNQMIGLGGWGGRSEKSGPYVYMNDEGKLVRDKAKGRGGNHGPQHEFSLVIREDDHPITKGLPSEFLHTKDELYEQLRGPAENMTILATSYAAKKYKGSGRHEPTMMTIDYEKGRVFHTTLGHADYSFECAGFITVMLRGTEWAATGKVTIPVPDDFPTADKSSSRKFKLKMEEKSAAGK